MQYERHEPIIIELDDPTPGWYRWAIPLGAVLALALFVMPWFLTPETPDDPVTVQSRQGPASASSSICRTTVEIPSFAQPAASMVIPGWMRLCDWFAQPVSQPADEPAVLPSDPAQPPRSINEHTSRFR